MGVGSVLGGIGQQLFFAIPSNYEFAVPPCVFTSGSFRDLALLLLKQVNLEPIALLGDVAVDGVAALVVAIAPKHGTPV